MKSKLLICLTLLATASVLNGQTLLTKFAEKDHQLNVEKQISEKQPSFQMAKALMNASTETLTRTESESTKELTLAYCSQDEYDSEFGIQVGINQVAINIKSTMVKDFIGNKATKIRVNIPDPESISIASVWITSKLGGTPIIEQTVTKFEKGWNEIALNAPYEIDGKSFYVGMTVKIDKVAYPFGIKFIDPEVTSTGSCYIYTDSRWSDMTSLLSPGVSSALQIQCVTEGSNMPETDIDLQDISYSSAVVGDNIQIAGYVYNNGRDIKSAEIAYTINNGAKQTAIATVAPHIKYDAAGVIVFSIPTIEAGIYDIKATITKINDEEDVDMDNNTRTTGLVNMNASFPRKGVVEEGTGNWHGLCAYGIVKMKQMKEMYPDAFIGISVHWSSEKTTDPMQIKEYAPIISRMGNIPCTVFNRISKDNTTNYYYINSLYEIGQKAPCEADLSLATQYTDDKKTAVSITSKVLFSLSHSSTPYRMAYVVVEDGVTGYKQINSYNRESLIEQGWTKDQINALEDDLQYYVDSPYNMDMTFDNVARGIYDCMGIEGSFSGEITENKVKTHTYTLELPGNIQNKENVRIIALLIREATGEIINAQQVKIGGFTGLKQTIDSDRFDVTMDVANDILTITANEIATAELYNTSGTRIATTTVCKGSSAIFVAGLKGIHIIRVNNGNDVVVKKIML